jgi:hypothetical protein
MVQRITIYGYVIPEDRFRGPGSGTMVDLVYHVDDSVTVGEILNYINQSGFKMVPLRYRGSVVQDKVTIEDLNIGIEPVPEQHGPVIYP